MFPRIIAWLTLLFTMIASLFGFGNGENYQVVTNIRYSDGERNIMDIYVPDSALSRPENGCILFIHGGSWTSGEKEDMADKCKDVAKQGYIAATMNYTLFKSELFTKVTAFTMLDEIELAIKKIKAFSDENNLNITKLATSGYSAGAHLSMLFAYSRPEKSVIPLVFTANQVGPSDFSYEVWGDSAAGLVSSLSGTAVTEEMMLDNSAKEITESVSPAYFINKNSVPSLFGYGGTDMIVPRGNAEAVKKAFENCGGTYDFILYPLSNHGLGLDPHKDAEYKALLTEYCKTYFGY